MRAPWLASASTTDEAGVSSHPNATTGPSLAFSIRRLVKALAVLTAQPALVKTRTCFCRYRKRASFRYLILLARTFAPDILLMKIVSGLLGDRSEYINRPRGSLLGVFSCIMSVGSLSALSVVPYIADILGRRWVIIIGCHHDSESHLTSLFPLSIA